MSVMNQRLDAAVSVVQEALRLVEQLPHHSNITDEYFDGVGRHDLDVASLRLQEVFLLLAQARYYIKEYCK